MTVIAKAVNQSVNPTLNSLIDSFLLSSSYSSTLGNEVSNLKIQTEVNSHWTNLQGESIRTNRLGILAISLINSLLAVFTMTEVFEDSDKILSSYSIPKLVKASHMLTGSLVSFPCLTILNRCLMKKILTTVAQFSNKIMS